MQLKTILTVLIIVYCYPIWSQPGKPKVTPNDYDKWSTLSGEQISPDGKWVAYKVSYSSGIDTLYLHNVRSGKRQFFAGAAQLTFSPNCNWLAVQQKDATLHIHDLQLQKSTAFAHVSRYEFTPDGKSLVILSKSDVKTLSVLHAPDKTVLFAKDVSEFSINKSGDIAWIDNSGIHIFKTDVRPSSHLIYPETDITIKLSGLSWNENGTQLAFFKTIKSASATSTRTTIGILNIPAGTVKTLQNHLLPEGYDIVAIPSRPLIFSDNGRHIFFFIRAPKNKSSTNELVEVWDASTPYERPIQEKFNARDNEYYLTQWDYHKNIVARIGTKEFPIAMLLPDNKKAIKYAPETYEPQFDEVAPVDYYIQDFDTGKSRKVLERHSRAPYAFQMSPSGKYIAYFKHGHWWLQDTQGGAPKNLTQNANQEFRNLDADMPGEDFSYGSPGFTRDSKYLILYDKFDVWLVEVGNGKLHKATDGVKTKTRFRLEADLYLVKPQTAAESIRYNIDHKQGLVFRAVDQEMSSGYFLWTQNNPLKKLAWGKSLISNIKKARFADYYLYLDQTASIPPSLKIIEVNEKSRLVFQSNPHYCKYQTGHSRLLTIPHGDKGSALATLLYPSDYVAGKKYPMIVYLYEVLSHNLHLYNIPASDSPYGFSAANYTLDGYFVLMPDIHYTIGNPGGSALNHVESAVRTVLAMDMVDSRRVGIIGHSFGGYQTTYIVTKSNLFAAAVIGSGVTDLVRKYFTMNFKTGRSDNWRIERQQFRMGRSPLADLKSYMENSPINFVDNITTPILNWAGKSDSSVSWEQGLVLHLALRRAGKPNTFLLYPNEGHVLSDKTAQLDLNGRIKNWFDSYLKTEQ